MTIVKWQRHTAGQVVRKLGEGVRMLNAGKVLAGVLRHLGIAESTWKHAGEPVRRDEGRGGHGATRGER